MIGREIREARQALGATLRQLAEACECAPSTLSRIEADKQVPRGDLMMRIARELCMGRRQAKRLLRRALRLAMYDVHDRRI